MSAELAIALIAAATTLLSIMLTFVSGVRKRDVESLKEKARLCDIELEATKRLFREEQNRLNNRVDDLLVAMAKRQSE